MFFAVGLKMDFWGIFPTQMLSGNAIFIQNSKMTANMELLKITKSAYKIVIFWSIMSKTELFLP